MKNSKFLGKFFTLLFLFFLAFLFFHPELETFFRKVLPEKKTESPPRPVSPKPGPLGADEQGTITIFEEMSPSVISIKNAAIHRDFFSLNVYEVPQGVGSGIIWDASGHIVTNFHVIYQADKIEVSFSSGSSFQAEIVGAAPDYDLAVLKIRAPSESLKPIPLGTSHDLKVGQKVLALGNPFGLDGSLTTGIISALGRSIESLTGHKIKDVIQIDATINPGNSGGALLDSFGRLIGINTAILSPSGVSAGIGFAVPVDTVNRVVPQLISHGKIKQAGLGISLAPDHIRNLWGLKGALILEVAPGSAASKAGLKGTTQTLFGKISPGDLLIQMDDQKIEKNDDLIGFLDEKQVNDEVLVQFVRKGEILSTKAFLQEI